MSVEKAAQKVAKELWANMMPKTYLK